MKHFQWQLTRPQQRSLLIVVAVLLSTLCFFSPFLFSALRGFRPELRFFGDLQLAGYPAFIQAGKYFASGIYYGQDMFTANGSSSFFTRPNFTSYYLPQLLLEHVFRVSSNGGAAKLFTVYMWLNGAMSMLFTTLWLHRFMKMDVSASIVGGALAFGISGYVYTQISFFTVACMFPVVMYAFTHALMRPTHIFQKLLLALPLVMIVTAGYLPIAVMGVCVAVVASPILAYLALNERPRYAALAAVVAIGVIVVSGYLVTVVNAVAIAPAIPKIPFIESVFFSDMSMTTRNALGLFFSAVQGDPAESPHIRMGLPILLLLFVSYSHLSTFDSDVKRNIFLVCVMVFLMSVLLGMGRLSGFADIFFYSVPGLGGMHIYSRYMLISVFFLVFAISLGLSSLATSRVPAPTRIPSVLVALGFVSILVVPTFFTGAKIAIDVFLIELLVCTLLLIVLNLKGNPRFLLLLVPILVAHQGAFMFATMNWMTLGAQGQTARDIVYSPPRMEGLINWFYANAPDKRLVKYIDLTPEIEKPGGVPHNFPWFIRQEKSDERRISSYMGYDQSLAQQLQYAERFSYSSKFDKDYLLASGCDFVIYDEKTELKEREWLTAVVEPANPSVDIGNGYRAAKLKSSLEPGAELRRFDNGVLAAYSGGRVVAKSFDTDWATKVKLTFDAAAPGQLRFRLFPHANWRYYMDEQEVKPVVGHPGLASFNFASGEHTFSIRYKNRPLTLFVWMYFSYLFLIFGILATFVFKVLRGRWRKRRRTV